MKNKNKIVVADYKNLNSEGTYTFLNLVVSKNTWKEIKEKTELNILKAEYIYFRGINDLYTLTSTDISEIDIYEFKSSLSNVIKKDNNDIDEIEYISDIIVKKGYKESSYVSFYLIINDKDILETLIKEEYQNEFEIIDYVDAIVMIANQK